MNLRTFVLIAGACGILAACSGGGTSVSPHAAAQPQPQSSGPKASGTLTLTLSKKTNAGSRVRKPKYVSSSTADAALFIDGVAAGRVTCALGTGGSNTCTITWTSTAGSHVFAVEIDDGQTVLAEGAATYSLTATSNQSEGPLTLNGVAATFLMESETLSSSCTGPNPSCFTGVYAVADADYNTIVTPGSTYDNGPLTVGLGNGSTVTSFNQSFIGNGGGAGGLSGPDANGMDYQFTVSCTAGATGSFTLAFAPQSASPPSGEVTPAELTAISVNYPSIVNALSWPIYTCTNGTISVSVGGAINLYTIPTLDSGPNSIVTGPDGALWFTENVANKIGRVTTAGAFLEYPIPTGAEGFFGTSGPSHITVGPDNALWFTEAYGNKIGRITTSGTITEYPVPTQNAQPDGITSGPGNALYFTEFNASQIGRITTGSTPTVTNEWPTMTPNSGPWGIVAGPDGNLWFTENGGFNVGSITTAGAVTEYPLTAGTYPEDITVGSDTALWFGYGESIGRITTGGVLSAYQIPTPFTGPNSVAAGPDGAIWFTEGQASKIGRLTTGGTFTEYPTPTANSSPYGITAGPDGNVWFNGGLSGPCQFGLCSSPDYIGRITPP